MIFTVTLNPAIDRTITLENLKIRSVNRVITTRSDVGGKGINVSKTLKSLGIKSTAAGLLGERNADFFIDYLKELDIGTDFYILEGEVRTNIKIVEQQGGIYTDINEKGFAVKEDRLKSFIQSFLRKVNNTDIVVLSGSLPPGADCGIYELLINLLNKRGARVILDGDGYPLARGINAVPYAVKPNIHELKSFIDIDEDSMESIIKGGKELLHKGIEKVMISMGSKGALYLTGCSCLYAKPLNVDIKSTVGAGDAMVAALVYSIEKGLNDYDTLILSCACSTASIMMEGTNPPSYEAIKYLEAKIEVEKLYLD